MKKKFSDEATKIEARKRFSTNQVQKEIDYSEVMKKIKEANEICKMLGKAIKFKTAFVKQMVDDSGRNMSMRGSVNPAQAKYKEDLQIQVHNAGSIMMWNQDEFEDRLLMMRDALVTKEISKGEDIEKTTQEIFQPIEEDIDTMNFDEVFAQNDVESEEIKNQEQPEVMMR